MLFQCKFFYREAFESHEIPVPLYYTALSPYNRKWRRDFPFGRLSLSFPASKMREAMRRRNTVRSGGGAPSLPRPQFAQRKVAQGGRGRRKGEPRLGHRRGVIGDHPFSGVGGLFYTLHDGGSRRRRRFDREDGGRQYNSAR